MSNAPKKPAIRWSTTTIALAIVGVAAVWYTMTHFVELSGLAFGIIKVPIGLALVGLVDNIILGHMDTIEELRKGNIAYGLVLASLVLFVGLCIAYA